MSEQVELRSQECQTAYENSKLYHEEQLTSFQGGMAQIRELLSSSDGFHANQINEKVLIVLEMVETQIVPQLKEVFAHSELSYQHMLADIEAEDELG